MVTLVLRSICVFLLVTNASGFGTSPVMDVSQREHNESDKTGTSDDYFRHFDQRQIRSTREIH